jgi:hypothetical protein
MRLGELAGRVAGRELKMGNEVTSAVGLLCLLPSPELELAR